MKKLNIPEEWSGKEALAVHDFLADIMEAIRENYEDAMTNVLQSEEENSFDEKYSTPHDDDGFDDEIPF